jgi:hypothetical protein
MRAIERFIGQKIPQLKLDNFNYVMTTALSREAQSGVRMAVRGGRTATGYSYGPRRRRR